MKDLIDRQDAKDVVDMELDAIDHVPKRVYDRLLTALDKVPSTQAELVQNLHTTCTDTISRQAAIEAYGDWYVEEGPAEGFIGTVKQLLEGFPSAQLDRDIPKKPREETDASWGCRKIPVCPECDRHLSFAAFIESGKGEKITYCEHCGQAIDWEGWIFDE